MHIPGHLSIALVQHMLPPLSTHKKTLVVLVAANLFPDIVDKAVGYLFKIMPNGRHFAHNLFSLAGTSALVTTVWGKLAGYAWFLGYLGHLLADDVTRVPWLFPALRYQFKKKPFNFNWPKFFKEMVLFTAVLAVYLSSRNLNQKL